MGTDVGQAKTLVCGDKNPVLYEINYDGIGQKTVFVNNMAWMLTIASFRGYIPETYKFLREYIFLKLKNVDIIAGKIADDRLAVVLEDFFQGRMGHIGLIEVMRCINLGTQFAVKTERACPSKKMIDEIPVEKTEWNLLKSDSINRRKNVVDKSNLLRFEVIRKGKSFQELSEILEKQIEKEMRTLREKSFSQSIEETEKDMRNDYKPGGILNM